MSGFRYVRLKFAVTSPTVKSDGLQHPFIGLEHVASGVGRLITDHLPMVAATDSIVHEPGDVLFGKLRPYLAKSFLATVSRTATSELVILRPGSVIDPRFLLYTTLSQPFLEWAKQTSNGTKMPRTSWEELGNYRISIPSLLEQRRISDFLDTETKHIDQMHAGYTDLRTLLAQRRISSVIELVSGASRSRKNSEITWLNTIPAHWRSVKLTYVARIGSGHTPSRSHPEWWTDCRIPWITTGEVSQVRSDRKETIFKTRENISATGLANSAAELCPEGTVVLCRTAASAGFSAVMGTKMATSQDFATWICGPQLDPYYLLWCLRAMRTDLLQRLATGSTHKTIYFPDLQSLRIPLPPLEEQQEIVQRIRQENSQIDRLLDTADRQLGLLAERRRALITAAVTGQLDVTTARSGVR